MNRLQSICSEPSTVPVTTQRSASRTRPKVEPASWRPYLELTANNTLYDRHFKSRSLSATAGAQDTIDSETARADLRALITRIENANKPAAQNITSVIAGLETLDGCIKDAAVERSRSKTGLTQGLLRSYAPYLADVVLEGEEVKSFCRGASSPKSCAEAFGKGPISWEAIQCAVESVVDSVHQDTALWLAEINHMEPDLCCNNEDNRALSYLLIKRATTGRHPREKCEKYMTKAIEEQWSCRTRAEEFIKAGEDKTFGYMKSHELDEPRKLEQVIYDFLDKTSMWSRMTKSHLMYDYKKESESDANQQYAAWNTFYETYNRPLTASISGLEHLDKDTREGVYMACHAFDRATNGLALHSVRERHALRDRPQWANMIQASEDVKSAMESITSHQGIHTDPTIGVVARAMQSRLSDAYHAVYRAAVFRNEVPRSGGRVRSNPIDPEEWFKRAAANGTSDWVTDLDVSQDPSNLDMRENSNWSLRETLHFPPGAKRFISHPERY